VHLLRQVIADGELDVHSSCHYRFRSGIVALCESAAFPLLATAVNLQLSAVVKPFTALIRRVHQIRLI
jgi:hypothetical protein